mgnify:CR=1 FL=1
MKKITKKEIQEIILSQYTKKIFEEISQNNPGENQSEDLKYQKIEKLAQLGEKINASINNSFAHLSAFLKLGLKVRDSFEFKRAVAELSRIQKLVADYSKVVNLSHETAEGHGNIQQSQQQIQEPNIQKKPNTLGVQENSHKHEWLGSDLSDILKCRICGKVVSTKTEGGPGSGRKTNAFTKTRNKQIRQGVIDTPTKTKKIGTQQYTNPKTGKLYPKKVPVGENVTFKYGVILERTLDEKHEVKTVDISAKNVKELQSIVDIKFPLWEISKILEINESSEYPTDMKGNKIFDRDKVKELVWDPNKNKYMIGSRIYYVLKARIDKLLVSEKGKKIIIDPHDVIKVGGLGLRENIDENIVIKEINSKLCSSCHHHNMVHDGPNGSCTAKECYCNKYISEAADAGMGIDIKDPSKTEFMEDMY